MQGSARRPVLIARASAMTMQIALLVASQWVCAKTGARGVALLGIAQTVRPSSRALLASSFGHKRDLREMMR
jgi:hypothetical protein